MNLKLEMEKSIREQAPQVAQALLKILLTVLVASQVTPAEAVQQSWTIDGPVGLGVVTLYSFGIGFRGYLGVTAARRLIDWCCRREEQVKSVGPCSKPASAEDRCSNPSSTLDQPLLSPDAEEAQRDEVTYQPTYKDLVAAYPQELRDYLHEQLNKSQRFGQEYVDRCAELRQVLHERCSEVETMRRRATTTSAAESTFGRWKRPECNV